MAGDGETAACVMRMDEGLDTGPICRSERVPIGADTTAGELHDVLAEKGAALMVQALAGLDAGTLTCKAQSADGVTYAGKIGKAETRLDFTRPAGEVHNRVRGLSPAPGAWLEAPHEGRTERIKVLRTVLAEGGGPPGTLLDDAMTIACGEAAVRVLEVQRPGRKPMSTQDFLRGFSLSQGGRLA
jgi:methionyl-tRNA formyltransferase